MTDLHSFCLRKRNALDLRLGNKTLQIEIGKCK